jgi:hypothetical protein
MKPLKYTILIAALASGLTLTAKADLVPSPFGDIPKNGTGIGGGNSDNRENNFFRLVNYIAANPSFSIGAPIFTPEDPGVNTFSPNEENNPPIDLTGFCYAVIHYGTGPGGTPGGGVAFFTINNDSDTPPAFGSGPNGFGGISRVDLFECTPGVPDGGLTVMLLGAALGVLGIARRYIMN